MDEIPLGVKYAVSRNPCNQKRHDANPNPSHGVVTSLVCCVFDFLNPGVLNAPYNGRFAILTDVGHEVVFFKAGEVSQTQFIFNQIAIFEGPFPASEQISSGNPIHHVVLAITHFNKRLGSLSLMCRRSDWYLIGPAITQNRL